MQGSTWDFEVTQEQLHQLFHASLRTQKPRFFKPGHDFSVTAAEHVPD